MGYGGYVDIGEYIGFRVLGTAETADSIDIADTVEAPNKTVKGS